MCTKRIVINREMLGNREICWSLWSGKDVMELTSAQIKTLLKSGKTVSGLTLTKSGELELDKSGFYCTNVMEHRHCSSYVPMVEIEIPANVFYIVIGSHEESGKKVYDCISTKYERLSLSEEDLRVYLRLGIVSAGAKLEGDTILLPTPNEEKTDPAPELPKAVETNPTEEKPAVKKK